KPVSSLRRPLLLAASTALVLAFLAVSLAAPAQTTGTIVGRATDEQGVGLPGVSVEAKGSALQGNRLAVTDANGRYQLGLLPPGEYTVTFSLPGFAPVKNLVAVSLGKETALDSALKISVTSEVTVTGEAPVVDTTSTTVGHNLDKRQIETLPTARNYSA